MYMMNDYSTGAGVDQYWVNNNTVGFSDNIAAAAGGTSTGNNRSGGSSSSSSKPIRRRSRVSKKTPITLLNTDATNFRSLVQQFTGCPHPPSTASFQTAPLDTNRGPLNLNFQLGTVQTSNQQQQQRHYQQLPSNITGQSSSMVNYHDAADHEITRVSGGHNHMEMVQELLMVDDSQDDFGLFR